MLTLAKRGHAVDPLLPSDSVFYADDIILSSLNAEDLQTRINIIQELAVNYANLGLNLIKLRQSL